MAEAFLDQVVYQYSKDMVELGFIENSKEFCEYYSDQGHPDHILDTVHQFMHERINKKTKASLEKMSRESEILSRLFPACRHRKIDLLLRWFSWEPNRTNILLCLLLRKALGKKKAKQLANDTNNGKVGSAVNYSRIVETVADLSDCGNSYDNNVLNATYTNAPTSEQNDEMPCSSISNAHYYNNAPSTSTGAIPKTQRVLLRKTFPKKLVCDRKRSPSPAYHAPPWKRTCSSPNEIWNGDGPVRREDTSLKDRAFCWSVTYPRAPDSLPSRFNAEIGREDVALPPSSSDKKRELAVSRIKDLIRRYEATTNSTFVPLLEGVNPRNLGLPNEPPLEIQAEPLQEFPQLNTTYDLMSHNSEDNDEGDQEVDMDARCQGARRSERLGTRRRTLDAEAESASFERKRANELHASYEPLTKRQQSEPAVQSRPIVRRSRHKRINVPHASSTPLASRPGPSSEVPANAKTAVLDNRHMGIDLVEPPIPEEVVEVASDEATDEDDEEDGAGASYCVRLVSTVMEMFPDACPGYIKRLCRGLRMDEQSVNDVVQCIFDDPNYPKRQPPKHAIQQEMDLDAQLNMLKELFPDADPTYLESQAHAYLNDQNAFREFVSSALENHMYPKLKDYLRRQQLNAQVKQYTTEFDVEKYLETIPDPAAHFRSSNIKLQEPTDPVEKHLCLQVLKNLYPAMPVRVVINIFKEKRNLVLTAKELDQLVGSNKHTLKQKRKRIFVDLSAMQNIPLLQEIAYLTNRNQIICTLASKKSTKKKAREHAKAMGLMQTCNCCYDDEVMPEETVRCNAGCAFCKGCVLKSVEINFGEGKLDFPCLGDCVGSFTLKTLRDSLPPKLFSRLAQKKQLEEVKAAGIEDLAMCPFCDFATIPPPGDKIFKCLNPECMKESCRQCKEPSHVPLRCDEIEKDDEVKKRTFIENRMTEALVRVCWKCKMKFIKEDGCNKMTCRCGAMMCYICCQPVKDYSHFNGQGGDKIHLCPLYSDTNQMHVDQIIKSANAAKQELGMNQTEDMKNDPTVDIRDHYGSLNKDQAPQQQQHEQVLLDVPPANVVMHLLHGEHEQAMHIFARRAAIHLNRNREQPDQEHVINRQIPLADVVRPAPPQPYVPRRRVVHLEAHDRNHVQRPDTPPPR